MLFELDLVNDIKADKCLSFGIARLFHFTGQNIGKGLTDRCFFADTLEGIVFSVTAVIKCCI